MKEKRFILGQIDLLFKKDGIVYVVDYKTDEIENPDAHLTQLKIYKKAALDLAKTESENLKENSDKPIAVKTFIFYLKTGYCVELEI